MTLPQTYSNQFKIDGLKLEYTGTNASWTHFIFNSPINHNQTASFKIKVIKTKNRDIMIGVVDYAKQKQQRFSHKSGNAMCYYGYGYNYPSEAKEGDGFRQGDVVKVDVNRSTRTIRYAVNGVLKATQINDMLADSSKIFMPYVDLQNTSDSVEWLL